MLNNVKTAALLAAMGGIIMAIGGIVGRGSGGVMVGLVIALFMVGGSYWFSDKIAIASARAQEVQEHQFPQYFATVRDLSQRAQIPMPRLYVAPNPQPNAFATGRNPSHAAVCINEGLMHYLTWDEISGVLAHELAHVRNRDILTSSVAAAIAMGITFAARMAAYGAMFGGGRGGDREGGGIADLLMIFLAPVAASIIQMAVSRSREFEADASAARLMGTGEPLARALEKLEIGAQRIPVHVNEAQAQSYIVNPLRRGSFAKLFSTHPTTADRIARLRGGAWQ